MWNLETIFVCRYLLRQGADPNGGRHEHSYTCLHFAGLAGELQRSKYPLSPPPAQHSTNTRCQQGSQRCASCYWRLERKHITKTLWKGEKNPPSGWDSQWETVGRQQQWQRLLGTTIACLWSTTTCQRTMSFITQSKLSSMWPTWFTGFPWQEAAVWGATKAGGWPC